jgi:ERCC4-type nuclease
MKLYVDSREPSGLIDLLKARVNNIIFGNLDLGDFIIKTDEDEIVMIFERKSLADLIASIKDGRYNEQSFRLMQIPTDNHHIYYVIEGNIQEFIFKNDEKNRKMLFSSMLSLSYTKGFSLLRASGWLETAEFIIRFYEKLSDGKIPLKTPNLYLKNEFPEKGGINSEPEILEGNVSNQYSDYIKTSKKSNITKDNIGEIMLAQIPGLSINTAQSLMVEFKTIKNLINVLENDKEYLDNFKIECKNGSRKISKTVIKNLKDYLLVD